MNSYIFNLSEQHEIECADHFIFTQPTLHINRCLPFHAFLYITKGYWSIKIAENEIHFKEGDIIIMPANIPHGQLEKSSGIIEGYFVHFFPNKNDSIAMQNTENNQYDSVCLKLLNTCCSNEIENILIKLAKIYNSKSTNSNRLCSSLIDNLLICLGNSQNDPGLSSKLDNIFEHNIEKILTNEEVATKLNISVKSLQRLTLKYLGSSIHEYQINYKLTQAKNLILYYDKSINNISNMLGFYDSSHFIKSFKNKFGLSPKQYQNKELKYSKVN